jgi:transposase
VKDCPKVRLLKTIPGIGKILSVVIAHEIGDVHRFPSSGHLAAYSGTTPRVHACGGKVRYGRIANEVNQYLKWAFVEAANCIVLARRRMGFRHIPELYERVRSRKGHSVAVVAVARHLAEAAFHVLSKSEPYREPNRKHQVVSSTNG